MELCTQCNQPKSAHTRRVFGHTFKRPQPEESNPGYAGDLVDALSDAGSSSFSSDSTAGDTGGDSGGCSDSGGGDCGGDGGGGGE